MSNIDVSREEQIRAATETYERKLRERLSAIDCLSKEVQTLGATLEAKRAELVYLREDIQQFAPDATLEAPVASTPTTPCVSAGSAAGDAGEIGGRHPEVSKLREGLRVRILEALNHYEQRAPTSRTTIEAIRIFLNDKDPKILSVYAQNSLGTSMIFLQKKGLVVPASHGDANKRSYRITERGRAALRAAHDHSDSREKPRTACKGRKTP